MNKKEKLPLWLKVLLIYVCIAGYCLVCFLVGGRDIYLKRVHTGDVNEIDNIGEIVDGDVVEQTLVSNASEILSLELKVGTYDRVNDCDLDISLLENDKVLASKTVDCKNFTNGDNTITFDEPVNVDVNQPYTLRITSHGAKSGNAVTVYYGVSNPECTYLEAKNIELKERQLLCTVNGKVNEPLGMILTIGVIAFLLILGVYCIHLFVAEKKGKHTVGMEIMDAYHQYSFLMHQLVSREFKVRYKRSALGILWSFVNPLLTMIVQFFVFTLVFKSAIPNYIVYLIIGITFFNFYSEATNGGSLSIITNASLIKKVYVPKYIYPLSQVFSASINFGISLILMFGVALVNGLMPNIYFLLIPFAMLSIFILNTGVALLLATGMTFFRDVQFIYNVFMTALTYATPMFWDMSMIPDKYNWIFKINPLADIIIFVRNIVLNNMYPGTDLVVLMIVFPIFFLMIGIHVFRKNQDKFILYI